MFLGSKELRLLLQGNPSLLEPYCGKAIEGSGVEVRVGKIAEMSHNTLDARLGVKDKATPVLKDLQPIEGGWWLTSGVCYHLTTIEKINLLPDYSGVITPRSTLQRCGVGLFVANIAPGYSGELSFGICNFRGAPFFLELEARVAFIQLAELKNQELSCCYQGNWQGGVRSTNGATVEHLRGVHNSKL